MGASLMQTPIKVSNIKSSDLLTESLYDIKDQEFTLVENKDNPMSLTIKKDLIKIVLENILKMPIKSFSVKKMKKLSQTNDSAFLFQVLTRFDFKLYLW